MTNVNTMIREDDMDMIRKHFVLLSELHHVDDANDEELSERIGAARRYIRRSCRKTRAKARRLSVLTVRCMDAALVLFGFAVVLALLVG